MDVTQRMSEVKCISVLIPERRIRELIR